MCIILVVKPDAKIPAAQLELACQIDKHGFGLTYLKDGNLKYLWNTNINDPKVIADHLQKLRKETVYLHLRHATVGEVNLSNAHPFKVLNKKKHGLDLAMMHNGTLYDYKPDAKNLIDSDTLVFNREFITPVALRFLPYTKGKIIEDKYFQQIVKKELGFTSVLLMVDSFGVAMIWNKDKGKQYDGYWASNDHLEDKTHYRLPTRTGSYYEGFDWETGDELPWESVPTQLGKSMETTWERDLKAQDAKAETHSQLRIAYECQKVAEMVKEEINVTVINNLRILKQSFSELSGISSLDKMNTLTEEDLIEMAQKYPGATARLVVELMAERRELQHRNEMQAQTIKEIGGK